MRVKICGITNYDDAINAINAGADALGFVFYEKSPRYIEPKKAKQIIKNLPPFVTYTGLFVNCSAEFVNEIITENNLDLAQIHFEANEDFFKKLKVRHIKVIRAKSKQDLLKYNNEFRIVDAFVKSYGGEGKRVNLEWFDGVDTSKIILAGGLTSNNLLEVIKYNFYGVDVSSGVEVEKGIKDKAKMEQFILNAKKNIT